MAESTELATTHTDAAEGPLTFDFPSSVYQSTHLLQSYTQIVLDGRCHLFISGKN